MNILVAVLLVSSLVLAGCTSTPIAGPGGDVEYRHPTTGDIQHCDNHTVAGALLFGVIGGVVSGNSYADCKNDLEATRHSRKTYIAPEHTSIAIFDMARVPPRIGASPSLVLRSTRRQPPLPRAWAPRLPNSRKLLHLHHILSAGDQPRLHPPPGAGIPLLPSLQSSDGNQHVGELTARHRLDEPSQVSWR